MPAKHLLIVDDDPDFSDAITAVFADDAFRTSVVRRCDDALAFLKSEAVDLALVDGMLQDGNGIDLIREAADFFPCNRIVFVSNYFRDNESSEALRNELGVALILRKPISPVQFRYNLEILLRRLEKPAENPAEPVAVAGFDELRRAYIRRLPAKIEAVADHVQRAIARDAADVDRQELRRAAHNLAGSAGSYGVATVGTLAAELERATDLSEALDPDALCGLLDRLRSAVPETS